MSVTSPRYGLGIKVGTLPPVILTAAVWIYLGWNFPGYCDRGDGLSCTGPGMSGLADRVLGFRSGGPFAGIVLIIFGAVVPVFLMTWSLLAVWIWRIPKIGKSILFLLYATTAVLIMTWAHEVQWQPAFVGDAWRGYLPDAAK